VGRWSRLLAARGARVTGIDLSPTMITQARRRTRDAGLASRCHFLLQDLAVQDPGVRYLAALDAEAKFDLVLGVTVLQHILDPQAVRMALLRMAGHLAVTGRMVLLEAAPTHGANHCDSTVFRARDRQSYLGLFSECGLKVRAISGVDPAPFKTWLLPHLPRLSQPLSWSALAVATALSAPIDALFGRRAVAQSWHAVFVLEHAGGDRHAR
jgi:SAM-dependent methyltransferase